MPGNERKNKNNIIHNIAFVRQQILRMIKNNSQRYDATTYIILQTDGYPKLCDHYMG